jgi:hypothetical protein
MAKPTRRRGIDPSTEKNISPNFFHRSLTHSVSNLLNWFDIITGDKFVVSIKEFNAGFLESPLCEQETFNTG